MWDAWGVGGLDAKSHMVERREALPGRAQELPGIPARHEVLDAPLKGPWPLPGGGTAEVIYVAMGCFWGAERIMWELPGVVSTAAGYMGGYTPHPTYEEVCSGRTGHAEAVLVAYDPQATSSAQILKTFWENHDPTQGMRQGGDIGTQYRSAIYTYGAEQQEAAERSRAEYGKALAAGGYGPITTEIREAPTLYFAEDYHQQYLAKNPAGYCGLGGTGVACPIGVGVSA